MPPPPTPFLFPGGPVGCLLLHGFTATPNVMRWMGEYLAREGHTVMGVRLPGHGTHPRDLTRVRWQDWMHTVEDGYHMLRSACQHVFVIGHSTGGALALLLAAKLPLQGVVGLSTLIKIPDEARFRTIRRLPYAVRMKIFRLYSRVKPFLAKGPPHWYDTQAQQAYITYPVNPFHAVLELRLLLEEMSLRLPAVTAPVLLIHSRGDRFVRPFNAERILQKLGSPRKEILWVEKSGHILPMDAERERAFAAIASFIREEIENRES